MKRPSPKPAKRASRPAPKPQARAPRPSPVRRPAPVQAKEFFVGEVPITDVRLTLLPDSKNNTMGFASITLGAAFVVTGLTLMNSVKGMFVGMPARKGTDGEYHDTAFPLTKEGRQAINDAILDAYDNHDDVTDARG